MSIRYLIAATFLGGITAGGICASAENVSPFEPAPATQPSKPAAATTPSSSAFTDDGSSDNLGAVSSSSAGGAPSGDSPELLLFKDMPVVVAAGMRQQTQKQAAASVTVV